jgi:hypothetical protein
VAGVAVAVAFFLPALAPSKAPNMLASCDAASLPCPNELALSKLELFKKELL